MKVSQITTCEEGVTNPKRSTPKHIGLTLWN